MKLAGRDDSRVRVGDYRVVYAVDDHERLVLVARIAHRREGVPRLVSTLCCCVEPAQPSGTTS